jgi:hypothetical protein
MHGIVKVQDGHLFETEENGDMKEYGPDDHSGPHCVICDDYWCRWCNPEIMEEVCPGRSEPTLDGMEWRQPQIQGVKGRRKPIY